MWTTQKEANQYAPVEAAAAINNNKPSTELYGSDQTAFYT